MTGLVDLGRETDIAHLDFSQAFSTVSHQIFIKKLISSEVDWKLAGQIGPEGCDEQQKV